MKPHWARATSILIAFLFLGSVWGIEPEPDWTNRFVMLKSNLAQSFQAPKVGEQVAIVRRIGGSYRGRINAITGDAITIDGTLYKARQLTDETCVNLFAEAFARQKARSQVLAERDAYRERLAAEQEQILLAASQAAKTSSMLSQEKSTVTSPVSPRSMPLSSKDAKSTAASHDSGSWKIILIVIGVCCVLAMAASKTQGSARARTDKFLSDIKSGKTLTPISTRLILASGEQAFLDAACTLYEARSVRTRCTGGIGHALMNGLLGGGGRKRYVSLPSRTRIDRGRLTLTNKRLVFDGHSVDRSIPLAKVMSANTLFNAIEVSTANREISMYFTVPNPKVWAEAIHAFAATSNAKA
jgi:hypothetical protein